jgi:chromodomain-helicase-DNA-binding protein 1
MSSSPEPSFANGHHSPLEELDVDAVPDKAQSESDLSEVNDTVVAQPLPSISAYPHRSHDDDKVDMDTPDAAESSDDGNDNASDDADFDMEDSPAASQSDGAQDERSASNESRPTAKRKVPIIVEEDEFMRTNPELYGLRRSVRWKNLSLFEPC